MAPDEQPPAPQLPFVAWLLPPLGIVLALALAIAAGIAWQGTLAPPPPGTDLAPIATGTHPFAGLAAAGDGDWCALVTSSSKEPALQTYFVRRDRAPDGRERIYVEATLVDRGGAEWLADAVGAASMATTGFVSSETETRTAGGRSFECHRIVADLPSRSAEEPARRTTIWVSRDVRSLGVVAARVELLGLRREVLEWELAGSGTRAASGLVAEWGQPPLELARSLTRRPRPAAR